MKEINPPQNIRIAKSKISKAGRGVFALKSIKKGEIIEECPVIVLPKKDYPIVKTTVLRNYYFMWGKSACAICLGFGSVYNHSYTANATYKKTIKGQKIQFLAIKDINKGEEITVNYNYGNPNDKTSLWIKEIKELPKIRYPHSKLWGITRIFASHRQF